MDRKHAEFKTFEELVSMRPWQCKYLVFVRSGVSDGKENTCIVMNAMCPIAGRLVINYPAHKQHRRVAKLDVVGVGA